MTRDQRLDQIQSLVNLLQNNPDIPLPHHWANEYTTELLFCMNPEEWHRAVKSFGGGVKNGDDRQFLEFAPNRYPWLSLRGYKARICERVVVATKVVPEQILPAQPEKVIPAHEEEIIEWRCKPFTAEVA